MTTTPMWLSGRRAVRPDRDVYRSLRRQRLSTSRRTSSSSVRFELVVLAAITLLSLFGWFLFRG